MIFSGPLHRCHVKRYIPVVHLMTLYCVAVHASRLADDQYDADMHIILLLMCIALLISDICSDESCIICDTNRRLSRGVWYVTQCHHYGLQY